MQTAEQLQDLIDRDIILEDTVAPLTISYSLETVLATSPLASHLDTLNSAQLASITQSTPASDVMTVLKKPPIGAAAEISGLGIFF